MKFKVDENLFRHVAAWLNDAGHEACTVGDQRLSGSPDESLGVICAQEGRAIVTLDLDFTDIRKYPPAEFPGIVVLRPAKQDRDSVRALIAKLLPELDRQPLSGRLWIVDESVIRSRAG